MKKSYEKPEVAEVKLAAEEAVLNNCKVTLDPLALVCRETQLAKTIGS